MERSIDLLTRPVPIPDERLHYGRLASQFADLRLPCGAGPFPVVAGIHGGWWRAAHGLDTHAHLCAALVAEGIATWNIEYLRIGEPGGGWPETLLDVGAALDSLREAARLYPLDLSRVVTVGFSAGGQLALWAASRHKLAPSDPLHVSRPLALKGAISLAGAVDLRRCAQLRLSDRVVEAFLGGSPNEVPERYTSCSPMELVPCGVPHTLVHGTGDTSVPHEISERYYAAATAAGDDCELILLEGAQHFELIDPLTEVWPKVCQAIVART